MRNGEDSHLRTDQLIVDRVRKPRQEVPAQAVLVGCPRVGGLFQTIETVEDLCSEGICRDRAAFEVPKESLSYFCLCFGQNFDFKPGYRALSLALASTQETASTVPAFSAACRVLIS